MLETNVNLSYTLKETAEEKKLRIKVKREKILARAKEARENYKSGNFKYVKSVDDCLTD